MQQPTSDKPAKIKHETAATEAPLAGANLALGVLLAINLINYIDRYIIAAVLPDIQKELFNPADPYLNAKSGWLAGAFTLSYMLFSPLFGYFGDRMRRWPIIAIGVILWSVASGLCGIATGFVFLLIMRVFVGIGEAAYGPTAPTLISDMYPVKQRGRAIAVFYIAIPVGSALGYIIGGQVAAIASWHWAFFVVAPPGIALGIWAMFMKEPPRGSSDAAGATNKTAALSDYLELFKIPSYMINCCAMAALTFCIGGVVFWAPKFFSEVRGAGDLGTVNTILGGVTVVAGLTGTIVGGWLGDKLRTRYSGAYFLVCAVGMIVAFPFYIAGIFMPFPYAWAPIGIAIFCLFINTGPSNTAMLNVVHPSMRSVAFAFNIFFIRLLGDASSPVVIGFVGDVTGDLTWGMAVVSVMMILGGVLWFIGMPYVMADTRKAGSVAASPEDSTEHLPPDATPEVEESKEPEPEEPEQDVGQEDVGQDEDGASDVQSRPQRHKRRRRR